ncbi:unnamed protein product, partial [Polarella glacialis]
LACEHEHSNSALICSDRFYVKDEVTGRSEWRTHIDFERFADVWDAETLGSLDYTLATPEWALLGSPAEGFAPTETRKIRARPRPILSDNKEQWEQRRRLTVAMAPSSHAQRIQQVRGLFFLLLVLGQEAQAVAAATGGAGGGLGSPSASGSEVATGRGDVRPEYFVEPDAAVTHLAEQRGSGRSLELKTGADWAWPAGSSLKFVSVKEGSGEDVPTEGTEEVQVCASLLYKQIEIKTAGTNLGDAHSDPLVKLVSGSADRTKCRLNTLDVPVGIAQRQNAAAAGSQQSVKAVMGKTNGPLALNTNDDDTLAKKV